MYQTTRWSLAALALCLSPFAAADVTVIDDTFTDGSNPGYSVSGGGGTATVATSGAGLTGNAMLLSTTSNNRFATRDLDTTVTLSSPGDYIQIAYDYRFTAALNDTFGFTTSFIGSSGAEGGINFNPSAAGNGGTYFADSDFNAGRFDTIDSGTTAHSLVLRITRTSATEVLLTSSFDGSARGDSNLEIIGADITAVLAFDALEIGWTSGNSGDFYFDNVVVTTNVVPEPGSMLLIGAGVLMLCRRRSTL